MEEEEREEEEEEGEEEEEEEFPSGTLVSRKSAGCFLCLSDLVAFTTASGS